MNNKFHFIEHGRTGYKKEKPVVKQPTKLSEVDWIFRTISGIGEPPHIEINHRYIKTISHDRAVDTIRTMDGSVVEMRAQIGVQNISITLKSPITSVPELRSVASLDGGNGERISFYIQDINTTIENNKMTIKLSGMAT